LIEISQVPQIAPIQQILHIPHIPNVSRIPANWISPILAWPKAIGTVFTVSTVATDK